MNLQTFLSEALKNNGGSYNITTGESNPTNGYMVSLLNNELVIDANDLCATVLSEYIIANADELSDDNAFVGLWINNGKAYLDVSIHYPELKYAIIAGMNNKQKAIWDFSNNRAITLPTNQSSGTTTQQLEYQKQVVDKMINNYPECKWY
jgi:hypothetical protein